MNAAKPVGLAALALALAACAAGPRFDESGVKNVTPARAVAEMDSVRGSHVIWGGVVVNSTNLADATRIEVLGYPLENGQAPDLDAQPQGRFLVLKSGYLETANYSQGRKVTVRGKLTGTRDGKVGEYPYEYPEVTADRIHLWPQETPYDSPTRFHFGVGVLFSN